MKYRLLEKIRRIKNDAASLAFAIEQLVSDGEAEALEIEDDAEQMSDALRDFASLLDLPIEELGDDEP